MPTRGPASRMVWVAAFWVGTSAPAAAAADSVSNTLFNASGLLAILAFLGKWLFDQLSNRLAAKQKFQEKTAEQVSALAAKHYWAVANATGTLAFALRDYLREIEAHLYVDWENRAMAREVIGEIAKRTAEESLMSLIRAVWHLHRFQFTANQTYLLPHHGAGRQLRRLYNRFRTSFRSEEGKLDLLAVLLLNVDTFGIRDKDEIAIASPQFDRLEWLGKPPDPAGTPHGPSLSTCASRETWDSIVDSYRDWLSTRLPEVVVATESMETFARLFQHELAILYSGWYKDRAIHDDIAQPARAVDRGQWPGVLGPSDIPTLARARVQSDFFGALTGPRGVPSELRETVIPKQTDEKDSAGSTVPPRPPPGTTAALGTDPSVSAAIAGSKPE